MLRLDMRPGTLNIRAARLPDAGDRLRARLGLERALNLVEAPRAGLLVVKKIVVGQHRGMAHPDRVLGTAVERRLADLRARAARPSRDVSAFLAEAVLFADEAELLACLARDWLACRLSNAWYWRALLGDGEPDRVLHEALLRHCRSLPPAFALLAAEGKAVAFAARLADDIAATVHTAVALAFGVLSASAESDSAAKSPAEDPVVPPHHAGRDPAAPTQQPRTTTRSGHGRLAQLVPEMNDAQLTPAQLRLLVLALALERAPTWTRTIGLAPVSNPAPLTAGPAERAMHPLQSRPRARAGSSSPKPGAASTPRPSVDMALAPSRTARRTRVNLSGTAGDRSVIPGDVTSRAGTRMKSAANLPGVDGVAVAGFPCGTSGILTPRVPAPWTEEVASTFSLTTAFGGIFYLVNVALSLGLYGDFTQPRYPNLALSPWDLLALVGRHWFGAAFAADPIWQLFATLAGRKAGTSPGTGFTPPVEWRLPAEWLDAGERPAWVGLHVLRKRLLLLHPRGFVLVQVNRPQGVTPMRGARAVLDKLPALREARLVRRELPRPLPRGGVARWVGLLAAAITGRLETALGVPAAMTPELLCRHPGVVRLSRGRLEVELDLVTLPVAIRMAGLDRDPGWIPVSGHAIAFRFT